MSNSNWPAMGSGGGGGVVTNAANVGAGVGVFQILSGTVLNFRSIIDGTGITWTQNVNDLQASITLAPFSTTDLAEGTNLYYTQARFDTAFAAKSTTNLAEGTNLYYTQARFDTAFAAKDTDDLAEGATNLYYTQARFDSAFAAKTTTDLTEGTNLYYTQARFDTAFAAKSTSDLTEGTNLYYTQARFDTAFSAKDTDDLVEGVTNLYFTQSRARLSISGTAPVSYDNTTGVISMHVADGTHDGYLSSTDWNVFQSSNATVNIRASEGGGTVTLTSSDLRAQEFDLSAAETVVLPTTGIGAGELWTMQTKPNGFLLSVQASDASSIDAIENGFIVLKSLVATPVSSTDWEVINYYSYGTDSINFVFNNGGGGTGAIAVNPVRVNKNVIVSITGGSTATTGTGSTALVAQSNLKAIYRPASSILDSASVVENAVNQTIPGAVTVDSSGNIILYKDYSTNSTFTNAVAAGFSGNAQFYPITYSI